MSARLEAIARARKAGIVNVGNLERMTDAEFDRMEDEAFAYEKEAKNRADFGSIKYTRVSRVYAVRT